MALIQCPDCGKDVSSSAESCNGCGAPIASAFVPEKGGTVPYSDQEVAVMLSKKKNTSHILHLLLCLPTVGLWVIIWILVAVSNSMENARIDRMITKGKKLR
jgi:hypothetical protein